MSEWSNADSQGIQFFNIAVDAKVTLRGRRQKRAEKVDIEAIRTFPKEWKSVITKWVKGKEKRKYGTLLKTDQKNLNQSIKIITALLHAGVIIIEEKRNTTRWEPTWIIFSHAGIIREALGLPDPAAQKREMEEVVSEVLNNSQLNILMKKLSTARPTTAIRKANILKRLDEWVGMCTVGTVRDFSLFAFGNTKSINTSEWKWLAKELPMNEYGVSKHTPSISIAGPISFLFGNGEINLACAADFIQLTPRTIKLIVGVRGSCRSFRVTENKTTFEHVAKKYCKQDVVLWVPGFAPLWWIESVKKLASLIPVPAYIAADPDPAGIKIALHIANIWESISIDWEPWGMDGETLRSLDNRNPLTDYDQICIDSILLKDRIIFKSLIEAMLDLQEKGEQEGIIF